MGLFQNERIVLWSRYVHADIDKPRLTGDERTLLPEGRVCWIELQLRIAVELVYLEAHFIVSAKAN